MAHLERCGVQTGLHYAPAAHEHPILARRAGAAARGVVPGRGMGPRGDLAADVPAARARRDPAGGGDLPGMGPQRRIMEGYEAETGGVDGPESERQEVDLRSGRPGLLGTESPPGAGGRARVRRTLDLRRGRVAAERYKRRYPAVRATREFQDLLDDPELDAVVIATPVFSHVALATRSLMAGKHTFVEKPLATSSTSADELVRLAAVAAAGADVRSDLPLFTGGARCEGDAGRGQARRDLLHLLQSREPRACTSATSA